MNLPSSARRYLLAKRRGAGSFGAGQCDQHHHADQHRGGGGGHRRDGGGAEHSERHRQLVDTLYSPFDQDVTITAAEGKTFPRDSLDVGCGQGAGCAR
ncbi:MAG: hypothetical protein IPI41_08020 [Flavobacteriales bacterium]|nr:hypothetical protein [Flavobacteriales bacterium]